MKGLTLILISLFLTSGILAQSNSQSQIEYLNSKEWTAISGDFAGILAHNMKVAGDMARINSASSVSTAIDQPVTLLLQSTETTGLFVEILKASGLMPYFESDGPFTFVVPNNDAIEALPDAKKNELLVNKSISELRAFVLDHVLPGNLSHEALQAGTGYKNMADINVLINSGSSGIIFSVFNNAGKNGQVHVIDQILPKQ